MEAATPRLAATCAAVALMVGLALPARNAAAEPRRYVIDPTASRFLVHVGKAGLLRFAGHVHEIEAPLRQGALAFDPKDLPASTVDLTVDAAALRVKGEGEPAQDVPKVQAAMVGPECLDAGRFPVIRFTAAAASAKPGAKGAIEIIVRGKLTLHGVSRDLTVPVHVDVEAGSLRASGTTKLRQTDFGIKPISVAGVVKVMDELVIEWRVVGRLSR